MRIGDKGTLETLAVWSVPLLLALSFALAIWGSVIER
jgi:hypothetical protein